MSLEKYMFMAEIYGRDDLVNTKDAKINAVIKDLKSCTEQGIDINDVRLQESICSKHGLQLKNLAQSEISRIEKALN